jgi:inosine-uridine nucleoside N-ribohydrolase
MDEKMRTAMASHAAFAKQLLAFAAAPEELRRQALEKAAVMLDSVASALQLDPSAFTADSG